MAPALIHEVLTRSIIGGFFEVHKIAGFGFLEPFYARALEKELSLRGHSVRREVAIALTYKGDLMGHHRLDMVVDDTVIIELKATENLHRDAHRQLLSYLRATGLEVGLLLHFSPSGGRFFVW
jgi:GxxExxY protein